MKTERDSSQNRKDKVWKLSSSKDHKSSILSSRRNSI